MTLPFEDSTFQAMFRSIQAKGSNVWGLQIQSVHICARKQQQEGCIAAKMWKPVSPNVVAHPSGLLCWLDRLHQCRARCREKPPPCIALRIKAMGERFSRTGRDRLTGDSNSCREVSSDQSV